MNIRPYAPQDWPEVCRIHDAARRDELTAAGLIAAYLTLEETAENEGFHEYEIRVAEVDGLLVGFVAFTDNEPAWRYVQPTAYRKGVGTALIQSALAQTKASMTAEVLAGNDAAIALREPAPCPRSRFWKTRGQAMCPSI